MTAARILVVDDSAADRASVRIAFEQTGLDVDLAFAETGEQAMRMLREGGRTPWRTLPNVMLLDIHMPGISGLDLLTTLKKDKALREIPVWMLSGANDARDVRAAYRCHASGFFKKPDDFEGLRKLADLFGRLCVEGLTFPDVET